MNEKTWHRWLRRKLDELISSIFNSLSKIRCEAPRLGQDKN